MLNYRGGLNPISGQISPTISFIRFHFYKREFILKPSRLFKRLEIIHQVTPTPKKASAEEYLKNSILDRTFRNSNKVLTQPLKRPTTLTRYFQKGPSIKYARPNL